MTHDEPALDLAAHRAALLAKARAWDEKHPGRFAIRDVTPEGYGPTEPAEDAPYEVPFESEYGGTLEVQRIRAGILEAQTLLRGKVSPEERTSIERSIENARVKLEELRIAESIARKERGVAFHGERGGEA